PGSEHPGMACQNLLDERRARARHADNKNGNRRRIPNASLFLAKFAAEHFFYALEPVQCLCLVVVGEFAPLQSISFQQMMKGRPMIAGIGECFAKRKV